MKKLITLLLIFNTFSVYAQDTATKMPPEETRPTSYLWWLLGVVITLGAGMLVYRMIKKDPRRDG